MHNKLIELAAQFETIEAFKASLLFHGTINTIDGELRGGGYDGVLWTAKEPTIAQTYIPSAGTKTHFSKPSETKLHKNVEFLSENAPSVAILEALGYQIEFKTTEGGFWDYKTTRDGTPCPHPKNQEVVSYIEDVLGYTFDLNDDVMIKSTFVDGKRVFVPEDYKAEGTLFIFTGAEKLNFYDMSTGESDLQNHQCHNIELFETLQKQDYDGVIIDDFLQSDIHGNVGHRSIGLFPSGQNKLAITSVPAKSFDWGESWEAFQVKSTEEFPTEILFAQSRDLHLSLKQTALSIEFPEDTPSDISQQNTIIHSP